MQYPILNDSENQMIFLVNELYMRSGGICKAGAGPGGIGISVEDNSPLEVCFSFEPKPALDCRILPEEIPEYTVGVVGLWHGMHKYLAPGEVEQLLHSSDQKTRMLAETLRHFEGKNWTVSRSECLEAFEVLADAEMSEVFGQSGLDRAGPKLEL